MCPVRRRLRRQRSCMISGLVRGTLLSTNGPKSGSGSLQSNRIQRVALLAACGIVAYQLFLPPVVGLANNGDFGKILGLFDLAAPGADEFRYAPTKYHFDSGHHFVSGFHSSETLLVAAAVAVNAVFSKDGSFDIRFMGAVHGALFLLAFYLFLPLLDSLPPVPRAVLPFLVVFVFCDVMYVSWLNSFHMDAAAYVFFLLAIVFFLRGVKWQSGVERAGLLICCLLLVTSKAQHCLWGALIALLLLWKSGALCPRGPKLFGGAAAALMLAATVFGWNGTPRDYAPRGYYSVIFFQILPASKDAVGDLRELGLDESYLRYIGTHAYSEGAPMEDPDFVRNFSQKTSYGRLAWFFIRRPRPAYQAILVRLGGAARQRPAMGNFDRSVGAPPFAESQAFSFWSDVKKRAFYEKGSRYLLYFVSLALLICVLLISRRRTMADGLVASGCALAVMALVEMLVASLADAVETTRHFFLFNAALDLILVSSIALLIHRPPGDVRGWGRFHSRERVCSRS